MVIFVFGRSEIAMKLTRQLVCNDTCYTRQLTIAKIPSNSPRRKQVGCRGGGRRTTKRFIALEVMDLLSQCCKDMAQLNNRLPIQP